MVRIPSRIRPGQWHCVSVAGTEGDRHALKEFRRGFAKATGRRLTVLAASADRVLPPHSIWVRGKGVSGYGLSPAELAALVRFRTEDDFAVHDCGNRGLLLVGSSVRGLHYAVYEVLGRMGFAWPSCGPEWEVCPPGRVHSMPDPTTRQSPRFVHRGIDPVDRIAEYTPEAVRDHLDWMVRNRMNRMYVMLRNDRSHMRRQVLPVIAREAVLRGIEVTVPINACDVVPYDLLREHPDYFAFTEKKPVNVEEGVVPVDGGYRMATQLCVSNPELIREYQRRFLELLGGFPEGIRNFCIIENDGAGYCSCGRCRHLSPSDQVQTIWNAASDVVARERPDIRLSNYAYTSWQEPAETVSIPTGRVHHLMYDVFCRDDERPMNSRDASDYQYWVPGDRRYRTGHAWLMGVMKKWVRLGIPVVVWHNSMKMYRMGTAAGLAGVFEKDFDLYERTGAAGSAFEGYIQFWHGFAHNFYSAGRMLWSAEPRADECLSDFCRMSFGPASGPMLEYLRMLERVTQAGGKVRKNMVMDRFSESQIAHARHLFRTAKSLAGERAVVRRIRDIEDHFRYLAAWRQENLHVRRAGRFLRRGLFGEAAAEYRRAMDANGEVACAAETIERRFGVYGWFWASHHIRRVTAYRDRMKPILQAAVWGFPELGLGTHRLDMALFDTPHYGSFGSFMSRGVRIASERGGEGRNELGFFFELKDPSLPCRLMFHGGNVMPPYDQCRKIRPRIRILVNGHRVYEGPSGLPNIEIDFSSGVPLNPNGEWSVAVQAWVLRRRNSVVMRLLGMRAGQSTHMDRVVVRVGQE